MLPQVARCACGVDEWAATWLKAGRLLTNGTAEDEESSKEVGMDSGCTFGRGGRGGGKWPGEHNPPRGITTAPPRAPLQRGRHAKGLLLHGKCVDELPRAICAPVPCSPDTGPET